ncbi:MAG TPA: alpha/beta fold hydrolase [Thermoanaerobaculia bacterium]|nr:alpha/beta fold hydrolase [Thermoanaerobaculia bacterium]
MTPFRFRLRRAAAAGAAVAFLAASPALAARKKRKAAEPTAVPRPPDPFRVTITTADGVALAASWRPVAGNEKAPAVLLVHDFSRERRELEPLATRLGTAGYATLAIDLRAHGESTRKNGQPIPISPRLLTDPGGFPRDVESAAAWMRARAPRTAALGFSVGGYLALLAAARGQVDTAIAFSVNEPKVAALAGPAAPAPRSLLLVACEDDPGRAESARKLEASAQPPKRLLLFPGAAHNLAVLREHPEAVAAILAWLAERIGPPAPAPAAPPQ